MNDTSFVEDDEICSFLEGIKKFEIEKIYNCAPPMVYKILTYSFENF